MTIGSLHKYLISKGHSKVIGLSPPDGNQKPLSELTPREIRIDFENATPEEEKSARDLLNTLDFTQPLPGVPRLEEFIQAIRDNENIPKLARLELLKIAQLLASARMDELEGYWSEIVAGIDNIPWLTVDTISIVEAEAEKYSIPLRSR